MRLFLRCFREGNVHVDAVVMLRTFDNENVKVGYCHIENGQGF